VDLAVLAPVPEPPYADPELAPDMVVMSEDESDRRVWHHLPDDAADTMPFRAERAWFTRDELPDRIRVVFDPREVTT
jgi:hypothetical protein